MVEHELAGKDKDLEVPMIGARPREAQLAQAQEEIKGLTEDLNHVHHDIGLAKEKIAYLYSEIQAEKREIEDAFERAHAAWLDSERLLVKLKEEVTLQETLLQETARVAHEAELQHNSLCLIQELETWVAHLESSTFETEIIVKYCGDYLGKV